MLALSGNPSRKSTAWLLRAAVAELERRGWHRYQPAIADVVGLSKVYPSMPEYWRHSRANPGFYMRPATPADCATAAIMWGEVERECTHVISVRTLGGVVCIYLNDPQREIVFDPAAACAFLACELHRTFWGHRVDGKMAADALAVYWFGNLSGLDPTKR